MAADRARSPQMPATPEEPAAERAPWMVVRRLAPLVTVAIALGVGYVLGVHDYLSPEALARHRASLEAFVAQNLTLAALAYVTVYVTAVALSFPGASILTMAGGFMFGWSLGAALTAVAATIGSSIIFLIARTAMGPFLEAKAGSRLQKLRTGFQQDSFHYLLFLRLVPLFPFWLVNVAPAFFGMRLAPYVVATAVGILPGTLAYSWFGMGLGTALEPEGPVLTIELLIGFAALAAVALLPVVIRRWRRARNAAE
jgi:uncharacterized membrane protein YdjX (TVP38/TMEM64 family)